MSYACDVRSPKPLLLIAQTAVATVALFIMPMAPPADGRMLLLPLTPGAAIHLPRTVLDHGARLVGAGPLPGSLVIVGDRAALTAPLLGIGAVAIATGAGGCTDGRA